MSVQRIAVIGECMVELSTYQGSIVQSFGGDTLNTAIYLSRLTKNAGVCTSYVTGLGSDPFSAQMIDAWQAEAINTDMVYLVKDKLPGIYAIETADDGERSFYYWRNDSAAKYWLRERSISDFTNHLIQHQIIYLSGISLAILAEDCRESLLQLLMLCHKQGVKIVFDNNYRPKLWPSTELARDYYSRVLKITDIAFLTFDDEIMLWGDESEEQAIRRTQQFGVAEIVIKRGAEQCFVVTDNGMEKVAALSVDSVIDTTAAGDSFSAGYLAKRILGGDVVTAARAGHKLAGTVIQHRGAIIPANVLPVI
ncbi:sugar kinase [Aliagarivorans taiwanensis]|uniref:sugar kinase n=1 Tax=Aliagarivorans taiwanensis TaxID=561966 RepID=UPI000413B3E3|nr:sugar kinase [Aliagarivorans taiwanensis]